MTVNYVKRKLPVPDRLDSLGYISQIKTCHTTCRLVAFDQREESLTFAKGAACYAIDMFNAGIRQTLLACKSGK